MPGYSGATRVDKALSNYSVAFQNANDVYGAAKLFPPVKVDAETGSFHQYENAAFLMNDGVSLARAPFAQSKGGTIGITQSTYTCVLQSWHNPIDLRTAASSDAVIREREDAVEHVTAKLLIDREVNFAAANLVTGTWTNERDVNATAADAWDTTTAFPIEQLREMITDVQGSCGRRPNVLGISGDALDELIGNVNTTALIGGATADNPMSSVLSARWLAAQLGLDEVVVLDAMVSTVAGVISRVATAVALVGYRHPRPTPKSLGMGVTFYHDFAGVGDGNQIPITVIPKPENFGEKIEGNVLNVQHLISADCGGLLFDILT